MMVCPGVVGQCIQNITGTGPNWGNISEGILNGVVPIVVGTNNSRKMIFDPNNQFSLLTQCLNDPCGQECTFLYYHLRNCCPEDDGHLPESFWAQLLFDFDDDGNYTVPPLANGYVISGQCYSVLEIKEKRPLNVSLYS